MINTDEADWGIEVWPPKPLDDQCVMIANIAMQPTTWRPWLISALQILL